MPNDESEVKIRKAMPPRGFSTPARMSGDRLQATVSFDPSNGVPWGAILLPVEERAGRWCVVESPGSRATDGIPTLAQAEFEIGRLQSTEGRLAKVSVKWPETASTALLLLLHQQVQGLGDRTFAFAYVARANFLGLDADNPARFPKTAPPVQPPGVEARETKAPDARERKTRAREAAKQAAQRCLVHIDAGDLDRGVLFGCAEERPCASAPAPGLRFALASCQYPAGMIDGGIRLQDRVCDATAAGPAERSLWRLAERTRSDPSMRLCLLVGDQVYVDATAGLFDPGAMLDRFSFAYERMFLNKGLQRLLRVVGSEVITILDDHEIDDNWEPLPPGRRPDAKEKMLIPARSQYLRKQRVMWPSKPQVRSDRLWREDRLHGHDFFFADTRTEREGRRVANFRSARIMGSAQMAALKTWIAARVPNSPPGFIVSSSILLPRRLPLVRSESMALHCDSWCGYPGSLREVLACLCAHDARRVVFLSGDEHVSCIATITIECKALHKRVVARSIHSSALYAPYPFANSRAADFASRDEFEFDQIDCTTRVSHTYKCTVGTCFPPVGDGFAVLSARQSGRAWHLDVAYDAGGIATTPFTLHLH